MRRADCLGYFSCSSLCNIQRLGSSRAGFVMSVSMAIEISEGVCLSPQSLLFLGHLLLLLFLLFELRSQLRHAGVAAPKLVLDPSAFDFPQSLSLSTKLGERPKLRCASELLLGTRVIPRRGVGSSCCGHGCLSIVCRTAIECSTAIVTICGTPRCEGPPQSSWARRLQSKVQLTQLLHLSIREDQLGIQCALKDLKLPLHLGKALQGSLCSSHPLFESRCPALPPICLGSQLLPPLGDLASAALVLRQARLHQLQLTRGIVTDLCKLSLASRQLC
mmetsp:Transcript_31498/g.57219  ORF Transcript_31498/g.57219 Transcript_31498/m.57219 type:complete len:276 (-) Transcript_31498:2354-3181(-)